MKNSKLVLSFALFAVLAAHGARVSSSTALSAAGAWSRANAKLGARIGAQALSATEYSSSGGGSYYAVKMAGGGTVFLASDDQISPVIAFTSNSDPDMSENGVLRTLLDKDAEARAKLLARSAAGGSRSKAARTWLSLAAPVKSGDAKLYGSEPPIASIFSISDLRVAPLVKSEWNQTDADGKYCYNYYTPGHFPCGCTATAAAQIMRYHKYPDAELPKKSYDVTVSGFEQTLDTIGESRLYDWDLMTLVPDDGVSDESCEAIGRLTYDIAIALNSSFGYSGTGASPEDLGRLFPVEFNYANGYLFFDEGGYEKYLDNERLVAPPTGLHTREIRNRTVYTNLDAGYPVEFGIYSQSSGHAVVADGYGFVTVGETETEYVHINMGWGGVDDLWYNIPEIDAANTGASAADSGMYFNFLSAVAYNVFPKKTGAIISGRVVEDEEGVSGATVVLYGQNGEKAGETVSDEHGIYSFILPAGTYSIEARSADGSKFDYLEGVVLEEPVADAPGGLVNTVYSPANVGNSWGNDLDLTVPSVRVGDDLFTRLDRALEAAADKEDALVEILRPTTLRKPVSLFNSVTIASVADDPSETPVTVAEDAFTSSKWTIQAAGTSTVTFSNVVFDVSGTGCTMGIDADETAKVAVAGTLSLGTVYLNGHDSFVIAAPVETSGLGIGVYHNWSARRGDVFGTYSCSYADAAEAAKHIADLADPTLTCVANENGELCFDRAEIDPSIACMYATDGASTAYYRSLDMLFTDFDSDVKVVLLRDCPGNSFTNKVAISGKVELVSQEDAQFTLLAGKDAGFEIAEGASLSVSNAAISSSAASIVNPLFTLSGGELFLRGGAVVKDVKLSGTASVVKVASGSVTMEEGSSIVNCAAMHSANSVLAAAIYLNGQNSLFDFKGGEITGCSVAKDAAGAVTAERKSSVLVGGSAKAYGNFANGNPSDIYLGQADAPLLSLSAPLAGYIGVRYSGRDKAGREFAAAGDGLSPDGLQDSLISFFSSRNPSLSAAVSAAGNIEWTSGTDGIRQVPESMAVAKVEDSAGTGYYASVADALAVDKNGPATVTLLSDGELTESVAVNGETVLDGGGFTLSRVGDFAVCVTNTSLCVTNLVVDGYGGYGRIFDVHQGSLVLSAGAEIYDVYGFDISMVAPVVVWGGEFTMLSGSSILFCGNQYIPQSGGSLAAGAVLVNGKAGTPAAAHLYGGEISYCYGARAGAVYIGNTATVDVKGDMSIRETFDARDGEPLDLVVQDMSSLTLVDDLTRHVYYKEGERGDTNVFGRVEASYAASAGVSNLVASARMFRHDKTGAKGVAVQNASETLLVWSTAVGDRSVYTNTVDGVETAYDVLFFDIEDDEEPEIVECRPFTFTSIEETESGKWRLVLAPGTEYCKYTLFVSGDLETWQQDGEATVLTADDISDEGEFEFEATGSSGRRFWYVYGEDGEK